MDARTYCQVRSRQYQFSMTSVALSSLADSPPNTRTTTRKRDYVFRRAAAAAEFLCSNCNYARHRGGRHGAADEPLHDRCAVQGYTECPSAHELAALLGVAGFKKPADAADEGWWNIWEEPQVLSLEDIIVPTASCHGFQPLVAPPSPKLGKNQSSPDGKTNEKVIRQLGELAESDCGVQIAAHEEAEQAGDQFSLQAPSEYITGHGAFVAEKSSHEVVTMPTPGCEVSSTHLSANFPCCFLLCM